MAMILSRRTSKGAEKCHEVLLFLWLQFGAKHQIEEFDRVIEGQQPAIMQVRRRLLDAPQREGLDRPVGCSPHIVDHHGLIEALCLQIVH